MSGFFSSGGSAVTWRKAVNTFGDLPSDGNRAGDARVVLDEDVAYLWDAEGTAWVAFGIGDHGALSGLSDDDHTQYALLNGRGGGQTLIGGTGAGDDLSLRSTSHGTKGSIVFDTTMLAINTPLGRIGVDIADGLQTAVFHIRNTSQPGAGGVLLRVEPVTGTSPTTANLVGRADGIVLSITDYAVTGSSGQSMIDASGTWNTSGTPTAIKLDMTDTASNAGSLLVDLQVG